MTAATVDLDSVAVAAISATATAIPYTATWPINQWTCTDSLTEMRAAASRILPVRTLPTGVLLTWSDYFAGAGGSSSGLASVPGAHVQMAVNHWPLAIETHNFNHPNTDHDVANVARTDPKRYPKTDCAWFSPECTYWSVARGEKCDYDDEDLAGDILDGEDDTPAAIEARWRSRMLMRDVVRFSEHHGYKAVVVENVPDILKWGAFDQWLADMHRLGYKHKVVCLNSAFANALGMPAPQLRDRVYIVFWHGRYKTPDFNKWLRPQAICSNCRELVRGVFSPKPGKRRPMRYGRNAQYFYTCPKKTCDGAMAHPMVMPAAAAIDFSKPAEKIGEKKRPIAAKTRARVAAGLRKYARPITATTAGNTFERTPGVRTRPVDSPLPTAHTTASESVAWAPGMLVPAGGSWNDEATSVGEPMRTRTTRENEAFVAPPFLSALRSDRPRNTSLADPLNTVVADGSGHAMIVPPGAMLMPMEGRAGVYPRSPHGLMRAQTTRHQDALVVPPLVVPLRNNGVATPAHSDPLVTFAAGGTHQALVMRNNTARGDDGQMSTPVGEPLRTLTTAGHQSLIRWDHLMYAYDTGNMTGVDEPFKTQTGVEGDALIGPDIDVDECTLRMLDVDEIQLGMAFSGDYVLLGTAKRDKVRMLGNAVTPNAARDLAAMVMEAITGVEIDPYEWALSA